MTTSAALAHPGTTSTSSGEPEASGVPPQPIVPAVRNCQAPAPLPTIMLPSATVSIDESAGQLFRVIAPQHRLFYRHGEVVELVEGTSGLQISNLKPVAAQSRFERYAQFQKLKRVRQLLLPRPARLARKDAEEFLSSSACQEHLPPLRGVLNCWLLMERNGQLHLAGCGYDPVTGLYVASKSNPVEVSLDEAVVALTTLLQDFDFVSLGDRSRALASFITPALKLGGFIRGNVPMDVAEANESQSGKTYRQRLVAAVYNQTLAVVVQRHGGGVGGMEESLADHLAKSRFFIQFDNFRGELDSPYLESFLTADQTFSARTPYHGSVEIDPTRFITFLSSNGFEPTRDLANRSSIIRIRRRPDDYPFTRHGGMDTLAWVHSQQPYYLSCVFTIIREWFNQGGQRTNETRHNFREWCQICDWIVQNLFGAAPLMEGHDEASTRAANPHLTFLRSVAMELEQQRMLGQGLTSSNLFEICTAARLEIPGFAPDRHNRDQGPMAIGRVMGGLFGAGNVQVIENFRITRNTRNEQSQTGNSQSIHRYNFERVAVPEPPQAVS